MKYNQRTVKMPDDKIQSTLDKHFSKTYPDGFHGYRGAKYTENSLFINPQKLTRTSKDSYNLYYVLMDNLPSYKDYPSRSKSIIFTNKESEARLYNPDRIFEVYPSNYAKLAVAEANDQYIHLPHAVSVFDVDNFYSLISDLVHDLTALYVMTPHLDLLKRLHDAENYDEMKKWSENISILIRSSKFISKLHGFQDKTETLNFLQTINNTDFTKYHNCLFDLYRTDFFPGTSSSLTYLLNMISEKGSLMDVLDDAFNPTKNKIRLMNVSEASSLMKDSKTYEIWTDSLCYLELYESYIRSRRY